MEQPSTSRIADDYSYNSITGNLINEINLLLKRPTIESNLSKVLKDFLKELNESDKYLANGIFNTRFVEAALLLQSAVTLYGKKVDLLWECVIEYHKKLISYEKENNKEIEQKRLEERQQRFRRKRIISVENRLNEKNNLINNFSFGNRNNTEFNLNQTYENSNLLKEWEKYKEKSSHSLLSSPKLFIEKHNVVFQPDSALYDIDDEEYIGRYDQIQSTTLIEELIELDKSKLIIDSYDCLTNLRIESYVISDFLYEHQINCEMNENEYNKDLNEHINRFRIGIKSHTPVSCKELSINLERLPTALIRDKMKRMSFTDSILDNLPSLSELDDDVCSINQDNELTDDCRTINRRNISSSQDSAFYDCDDNMSDRQSIDFSMDNMVTSTPTSRHLSYHERELSCNDLAEEPLTEQNAFVDISTSISISGVSTADTISTTTATTTEATFTSSAISTTFPTTTEPTLTSSSTSTTSTTTTESISPLTAITAISTTSIDISPTTCTTNTIVNNHSKELCLGSTIILTKTRVVAQTKQAKESKERDKVIRIKRLSLKQLLKLSNGVTTNWKEFERFYGNQYESADGEDGYQIDLSESDRDEIEDFISSDIDNEEIFELNNNENTKIIYLKSVDNINQSTVDIPESSNLQVVEMQPNLDVIGSEEEVQPLTTEEIQTNFINTTEEVQADFINNTEEIQTDFINTTEEIQTNFINTTEIDPTDSINNTEEIPTDFINTTKEVQSDSINNNLVNCTAEENLKNSVSSWKSFLLPKLKKLNESDFDIHEYESKILNSMEVNETKYFNDIVKNSESAADVVRHFIASLQLANTNNIKIIGRNQGKIANDTLQIKVIDKTKHHELLEDYQAPSTESFKERLSRARQMNSNKRQLESVSSTSKKLKIVHCRWKD